MVFTKKEAPPTLQGSALRYARVRGDIIQIKRGLYVKTTNSSSIDPYTLLAHGFPAPVVSHHTALELHGYAYSHRIIHTTFTDTDQRSFQFQRNTFIAVAFPKVLREKQRTRTETIKVFRAGESLIATSLERTLVDCLARPDLSGGLDEVKRGFELARTQIDVDRLCKYVVLLENKTLTGLVGLMLERLAIQVSTKLRGILHRHAPKSPQYARATPGEGTFIKNWNVVVPKSLVPQTPKLVTGRSSITFSTYDAEKVRRAKAENRRAILRASPAKKLAMQHTHSIVGYNRDDFKQPLDLSRAAVGFL